ncbi:MAG: Peptidyl-prolyl cis-trans isomerase D [Chromatiales bacterium USCg_Taylor]|nr:MAG: Peptidyl-prolyl cis-trans isomerase D [Chromatiales bacterium USCg_Taylor]
MLQSIHDRAQGWLAWIIIGLICIPFAFWGIQEYFTAAEEVAVAEVNGEEVELDAFQQAYQQYRKQYQVILGRLSEQANEDGLKQQTLDQMVEMLLKKQLGEKLGLRISDRQVTQAVKALPAFQRDGKFSNNLYERGLQSAGMSAVTFEEQLRRELLTDQVRKAVIDTSFVTKREIDLVAKIKSQTRLITYAIIAAQPLQSSLQVSDEEIARRYKDEAETYTAPEKVKIAYLELALEEIAKQIEVTPDALSGYYGEHKSAYTLPEQRRARHILIKLAKEAGQKAVEKARKEIEALAERMKKGESFEDLAAKYSEDVGSKSKRGDLGFFQRGVMAPPFEEAVYALKPGEISRPVRTDFGFHLIRLDGIREGKTKLFEEVREEIEKNYRNEQAERRFFDLSEKIETLTYEHPDTLDVAAQSSGLKVQESAYFGRTGGEGIGAHEKVSDAAFSPEVLEERLNSEPLELGDNHIVVIRVKEHRTAKLRPLNEVKNDIKTAIASDKAKAAAKTQGEALLERLQSGEGREQLASKEGLKWAEKEKLGRDDTGVDNVLRRMAFKLPRPNGGKASYGGGVLDSGDYALIALLDVDKAETVDVERRKQLKDELLRNTSNQEWRDLMSDLRRHADIAIFSENL